MKEPTVSGGISSCASSSASHHVSPLPLTEKSWKAANLPAEPSVESSAHYLGSVSVAMLFPALRRMPGVRTTGFAVPRLANATLKNFALPFGVGFLIDSLPWRSGLHYLHRRIRVF